MNEPLALTSLQKLNQLRRLKIEVPQVTPELTESLESLTGLESLTIISSNYTEGSVPPLAKLKQLKLLNLEKARLSTADLSSLAELNNLVAFGFQPSNVPWEAYQQLLQANPNLKYFRAGPGFLEQRLQAVEFPELSFNRWPSEDGWD